MPPTEPCRQLAVALTRRLPDDEQRQWSTILVRWNQGQPFPLTAALLKQTLQTAAELTDVDPSERDSWRQTLQRFGTIYGDAELPADGVPAADEQPEQETVDIDLMEVLSDEDAVRLVAWLNALDAAALGRVVDGSVWRSADFDAFYLQLAQAKSLNPAAAAVTAVVPLLQQPEVYQGQLVRVSGVIAKADRMDASANSYSIDEYWQLWIRPDLGGDRPIVLVVPQLPAKIKESVAQGGQPRSRFVGRFFKRLAYRSQVGADLAPVVIGRTLAPRPIASMARAAPSSGSEQASDSTRVSNKKRFLLTLLIASVTGVSFAVITMWRASVLAKRSRELRARNQRPQAFLDELSQTNRIFESDARHDTTTADPASSGSRTHRRG